MISSVFPSSENTLPSRFVLASRFKDVIDKRCVTMVAVMVTSSAASSSISGQVTFEFILKVPTVDDSLRRGDPSLLRSLNSLETVKCGAKI